MAKGIAPSLYPLLLAALFVMVSTKVAADKRDFSGSYTLKASKGTSKSETGKAWTLRVTQSESTIEVAREADGQQNINKFPLDGSEGTYISPGGPTGTCKAQFKSKYLILDKFVTTHPQPNGPAVQMHTRERWELSADSNTLTVRSEVDFPQYSGILKGFQVVEPWSEIYTRK